MLILQRKVGESLLIGDDVVVTVTSIEGGRVHLAVDAPRNVKVLRNELKIAMDANQDAANELSSPEELMILFRKS